MNNHNRRYFTPLLPCRCGMEPMRVYCDATDRYAVKCDCGNRTKGFTTIAGASNSWNTLNKKVAAPGVQDRRQPETRETSQIIFSIYKFDNTFQEEYI